VSASQQTGSQPSSSIVPGLRPALLRYRAIAYVVGVMLLLLVFLAMPLKYIGDDPSAMNVIGPLHGFLYVVYLLGTFDLGRRARFGYGKMLLVALAGTIPFMSFVAERRLSRELTR
jgi:integral membrane protein